MAPKTKRFVGNAAPLAQVWAFSPPVSAGAPVWTLKLNGKSLSYTSDGTVADAVKGMQKLWAQSTFPDFKEIVASVPTISSPASAPNGTGTNEVQAIYLSGDPSGGSFQIGWAGISTPFLSDPGSGPAAVDAGALGNLNGSYRYTVTFLNVNPLGQIGETKASPESPVVSLAGHQATVTLPAAAFLPNANQVCIGRRIYRTAAGGAAGTEKLVATVWDNTTTSYTDNLADGSLSVSQPTSNSTGIPYNATAAQLQGILQQLASILPGNLVVTGSGTPAAPWLVQFANSLGAISQPLVNAGAMSLNATVTVPAGPPLKLVVAEVQQGLKPGDTPRSDGQTLLLVGRTAGVPFYVTSSISGTVPPVLTVSRLNQTLPPSLTGQITVTELPASITVQRTQTAIAGANEAQQLTISPDALAGSSFILSFGGSTTNAIPIPPSPPSAVGNGAGNLAAGKTATYCWLVTYLTAAGETEPSAPSVAISLGRLTQATVAIPKGPTVVTARRIYRTQAGAPITGPYFLVATINDNTTTSYNDNIPDATIALNQPPPTTNGVLQGELESLSSIGQGNVQVSGANFSATPGMTLQQGFPALPPAISTALAATPPPSMASAVARLSGGALTAGTYYYAVTAVDSQGETLVGQTGEMSATVLTSTGSVILTWNTVETSAPYSVVSYRIYRGTSSLGENTLVGIVPASTASTQSFVDFGTSPSPIVYKVAFINSLANAPQALLTGNSAGVTILPPVEVAETQSGSPVQNEVQEVGWTQLYGVNAPIGSFTLTFPALKVTTGPIGAASSPAAILAAIRQAAPLAYYNDFSVTPLRGSNAGYIWAIQYQGTLGAQQIPLAVVDLSGMQAAADDTLSPYAVRAQIGSPVGSNEIITATISGSPSGGKFYLAGTLANGNVISTSLLTTPGAPSVATGAAGSLTGTYLYKLTFVTAAGNETNGGAESLAVSPSSQQVNLSNIPLGPPGCTARNIYRTVAGGPSGSEKFAATINDNTTTSFTDNLADGSLGAAVPTGNAMGVAYNATAATLQSAFPAGTVNITGNAGGPYTIEAVGEAGSQKVVWVSGSNLSAPGPPSGTPPNSNTAAIPNPVVTLTAGATNGALATGTYYYKVTAVNPQGETNGAEVSVAVTGPTGNVTLSWAAIATATSYNIYRGATAGGENTKIANTTLTSYTDYGGTNTAATPPISNTATLPAPTGVTASVVPLSGVITAGTYYYKVTATDAAGETTASSEVNAVVATDGAVLLSWTAVAGATGYKIYRGTAAGSENVLVATLVSGTQTSFYDTGVLTPTTVSPPNSYTAPLSAPTLNSATAGTSGLLSAGTYYYQVTALNALGETVGSNELSAAVAAGGNVTLAWSSVSGANNYKVYRGTAAGAENKLIATVDNTAFIDSGASTATSASPPVSNTTALPAPTISSIVYATPSGLFGPGTYYYKITATNSNGETTPSSESFDTIPSGVNQAYLKISWTQVAGATGYNVYRGVTAGGENELVGVVPSGSQTTFYDTGVSAPISQTPAGETLATLSVSSGSNGMLSAGTYYYKVAEFGVTSTNESSVTVSAGGDVLLSASGFDPDATIRVYRGASTGGENLLLATVNSDGLGRATFYDTGASPSTASPPGGNTTALSAPVQTAPSTGTSGLLSAATYYYKITATNAAGETTASNEESIAVSANGDVLVSWDAVTGATGYKVYRGTAAGSENLLVATITSGSQTSYYDDGVSTPTTVSPPTSNSTGVPIPTQNAPQVGSAGILTAGTYYYEVTAYNGSEESTISNEVSAVITGSSGDVLISWTEPTGYSVTGFKVYRGTSAGGENKLLATLASSSQTTFYDTGANTPTSVSPPGSNTATITVPVAGTASAATTGGLLATAYYLYEVTAITANGETPASNTEGIAITGPNGVATVNWTADAGATGYNLYRGTGLAPPGAPTVAAGATGVLTGSYLYRVTFVNATGETNGGTESAAVSLTAQQGSLSNIPLGAAGTTARNIYRTAANGAAGTEKLVHQIADNTTTTYTDNTADGSLGAAVPTNNTTGVENTLIATINSGAAASFDDAGPTNATATPPASNTAVIVVPTQAAPSTSPSGGTLASATYYYVITALTALGETTRSNEESIAVTGPTGEVALSWTADPGAIGYKIYRGPLAGGENVLVGIVGAVTSFSDQGNYFSSLSVVELQGGVIPKNDVQTVTLVNAGGGTFGLQLGNQVVSNIPYNVSAADLQTDLQLLPNVGNGNCTVSRRLNGAQTVHTVTFNGALSGQAQPLMLPLGNTSFQKPPTVNTLNIDVTTTTAGAGSSGQDETITQNFGVLGPPTDLAANPLIGGNLSAGTYYYVITSLNLTTYITDPSSGQVTSTQVDTGESTASIEVSATVVGGNGTASVELTWIAPVVPKGAPKATPVLYNIYRGINPGGENQLIASIQSTNLRFIDDGNEPIQQSTLLGGGQYVVSLSPGATDSFTLSFGGQTTASIAANASPSTLQADLQALPTIGANVAVTGVSGAWNVGLTASIAGTGTLSGTMDSITSYASYSAVFAIDVQQAIAGSFTLNYGSGGNVETTAGIAYNATAAQVQSALSALSFIGGGNVTVAGQAGGPFLATVQTNAITVNYTLAGNGSSLVGLSGSFAVYPLIYGSATGPNFFDAPSNWADGAPPSLYLAPPEITSIVPTSTDATLDTGTHGSLLPNQAYYYVVTAINANGETVGSAEASGVAFTGAKIYFNGTAAGGTFTLSYGGQITGNIAYNANAAAVQADLQALSSIGSGNCTVTGAGTAANPFVFSLSGSLAGTAPTPLTANSSLTGATISVVNGDTRSLAISWNEVYGATGYKLYRGIGSGQENALVATLAGPDVTTFIDDGTYTTTAATPPSDANSYHTAVGDDVYFTASSISCLYNIAADVSCGYSVHGGFNGSNYSQVNSLTIDATYTGRIGLPARNGSNYQEYRPLSLAIQGPPGGVFSIAVGSGVSSGSPFISLDTGSSQISMVVNGMATTTGTVPSLLLVGSNPDSEIDLFKGSLGIAIYPGQTAQVGTIRQAYQKNIKTDTTLTVGAGCQTIPALYKNGGTSYLSTSVTMLTGKAGTVSQDNGGVTALDLENTTYISKSTGAIGSIKVTAGGKFDRSQDSRPISVGSASLYAGATYLDPHGVTVQTGNPFGTVSLVECGLLDVTLDLGRNITLERTQN